MYEDQKEVKSWMQRAKQETPEFAGIPSEKICKLRVDLIQEELNELKEAIANGDLVEIYDALLDIKYVNEGAFVAFGLDAQPGWEEVCRSNNTKFREGYYHREDGKLIKSPLYEATNLAPIVKSQLKPE